MDVALNSPRAHQGSYELNIYFSGGGRLDEYDECWPIRFSVRKMYGTNAESEADQLTRHTRASIILRSRSFIISVIDAFIYKVYLILH